MATQAKEVFLTPPLTIAGCRLWFDAADSSTITGTSNVTAWRDKTASLTLTGSGPTYSNVNGYPTITFNGNQLISSRNLPYESVCTSDANFTTFIVQLTTSASGVNGIPFMIYLTDNVRRLAVFSSGGGSGGIFIDGASQASPRLGGITQTLNTPQLLCITRKNITTMTARLNGSQVSSADFPGTTNFISSSSYFVFISNGSGPWTGNMYEILHYNRDISDLEIQQVEGYLAWKWGLQRSLPRSHPFFSASPYQTLSVPISRSIPLRMSSSTYFSPTAISGCQVWLDAADITSFTLSGSNVTQWRDKSGTGNNYANNGTVSYTNNSVYFSGSSDMRNTSPLNFSTGTNPSMTTFIIFSYVNATSVRGIFQYGLVTCFKTGYVIYIETDNKVYGTLYCADLNVNNSVSPNVTTIVSDVVTYTGTSGSLTRSGWVNGAPMSVTNVSTTGVNLNLDSISTLGNSAYGDPFLGYIFEVIYFNQTLNTTQRQQIEGYLAWKWGLQASLPPTHPNYTIPYVPFPFPTSIPKAAIRAWSPLRVSGSQLWLDAADSSSITGTTSVTEWRDKSGNARHLGVGAGTTSYSSNAIQLNSSYMFVDSPVNLSNVTMFILAKTTGGNNQTVFTTKSSVSQSYNTLDGFGFYMDGTTSVRLYGQYGGGVSSFATNTSTPKLFSYQSSGTSISVWMNAISQVGATLSSSRTSTAGGFGIGAEWTNEDGGRFQNFYVIASINEVIVYNSALTTAQRQQVEGYLAWKWGLRSSLPAGHPYINFPPSP